MNYKTAKDVFRRMWFMSPRDMKIIAVFSALQGMLFFFIIWPPAILLFYAATEDGHSRIAKSKILIPIYRACGWIMLMSLCAIFFINGTDALILIMIHGALLSLLGVGFLNVAAQHKGSVIPPKSEKDKYGLAVWLVFFLLISYVSVMVLITLKALVDLIRGS